MNIIECPLETVTRQDPLAPFIYQNTRIFSRHQINEYVKKETKKLEKEQVKSKVIAINATNSFKNIILCLALWRLQKTIFLLNPNLPEKTRKKFLSKTTCKKVLSKTPLKEIKKYNKKYTLNKNIPATYMLTSGTTKEPKIAIHTIENFLTSTKASQKKIPLTKQDKWLLSLPIYHVSGLNILFRCLTAGSAIVIKSKKESLEKQIKTHQITHISVVLPQLIDIIQSKKKLPSLKCILAGGSPFDKKLLQKGINLKLPIHLTYGMTETSSQIATTKITKNNTEKLSILPHIKTSIIKNKLYIKSKSICLGYLINKKIKPITNKKGYFCTNDSVNIINNSIFNIKRTDNQLISGGENIQPNELKSEILKLSNIIKCNIKVSKNNRYGQKPIAYIETKKKQSIEIITKKLKRTLPKYKIPQIILIKRINKKNI